MQLATCIVAKRPRHYYEVDSDASVEQTSSKRRRQVVELSPPPRSSDVATSTGDWNRVTRHHRHKQMSKTSRFITDTEDGMSASDQDEAQLNNDSDEEFTLGPRRPAAPRRQPRKSQSTATHYVPVFRVSNIHLFNGLFPGLPG